jgi:hypothetical protein
VALSLASNELMRTRALAKETVTRWQGKSIQKQQATSKKKKEKQRKWNYVPLDSSAALWISRHLVPKDMDFCIKGWRNKSYKQGYYAILNSRAHIIITSLEEEVAWCTLMSTHASVLVDSVGPLSAEVCRTTASFP